MTDSSNSQNEAPRAGSEQEPAGEGPVVRDRRRIDPETGEVRVDSNPQPAQDDPDVSDPAATDGNAAAGAGGDTPGDSESPEDIAAGLQDELLREKAARHNERERFKRERAKDRDVAISTVVEALLPVMDDVHYAREHGELEGTPFQKVADKLEATLGRFGMESFGAVGEAFDPALHEALMHVEAEVPEGSEGTTIVQVMQPGFKVGERVVRPARVSVADPS